MSYIRVLLRGSLPNNEVWSVAPAYNESTNVTDWNQAEGLAAVAKIAARTTPIALRQAASSVAPITSVRVERRNDAGELLGAAEGAYTAGWSTGGAPTKPPQTAIVLSLRTDVPGGSGRGRLYWPALGTTLSTTTVRLTTPAPSDLATAAVQLLDGIETDLKEAFHPSPSLIDFRLCVVSHTKGARYDINRIEVGDILDIQRRRRDKMIETYVTTPYPA